MRLAIGLAIGPIVAGVCTQTPESTRISLRSSVGLGTDPGHDRTISLDGVIGKFHSLG